MGRMEIDYRSESVFVMKARERGASLRLAVVYGAAVGLLINATSPSGAHTETYLRLLPASATASTNVVARQVQYGFTLQNTRADLLSLAELWVYGPAARTASQVCRQIRSSHPHQLISMASETRSSTLPSRTCLPTASRSSPSKRMSICWSGGGSGGLEGRRGRLAQARAICGDRGSGVPPPGAVVRRARARSPRQKRSSGG